MFRLVVVVCLCTAPAHAEGVEGRLQGDHFVWAALSGAGVGAAGGVLGAAAGSLLDAPCVDRPDAPCPPPAFALAGLWSGLVIGSAAGVGWYGDAKGYDGSFVSALYGSILGNLASGIPTVLIAATVDDGTIGFPLLGAVLVGFPAIGATIGYQGSLPDPDEAPPAMALLDYAPETGLRLGVPPLAVGPDLRGGVAAHLPLLSGVF